MGGFLQPLAETSPILLVVHPGSIGDVLLSLEAIRGLRFKFPSHQLVWIGQAEIGRLLLECHEVDEIFSLDGPFFAQLFLTPDGWDEKTRYILDRCTHLVVWMNDREETIKKNLQNFGQCSVVVRSPKDPWLMNLHAEDRFLETLNLWGVTAVTPRRRLYDPEYLQKSPLPVGMEHEGNSHESKIIVVHPGSGSPHKCVDSRFLAKVVGRLLDNAERKLVVIGGPADERSLADFLREVKISCYEIIQNQPLNVVARFLSKAHLFLGHDSGLSHLAGAVGVPSILLFGPTDPAQWAPRGPHMVILRGPTCNCPNWNQVLNCPSKPCLKISDELILQQSEHLLRYSCQPVLSAREMSHV